LPAFFEDGLAEDVDRPLVAIQPHWLVLQLQVAP